MNLRRFSTHHDEDWRNEVAAQLNTVLRRVDDLEASPRLKTADDLEFREAVLSLAERVADFEEIETEL